MPKTMAGRNVSVISDMGSFFYYDKTNALVEYEMQLSREFNMILKGICLAHIHIFGASQNQITKTLSTPPKSMHLLPSPRDTEPAA